MPKKKTSPEELPEVMENTELLPEENEDAVQPSEILPVLEDPAIPEISPENPPPEEQHAEAMEIMSIEPDALEDLPATGADDVPLPDDGALDTSAEPAVEAVNGAGLEAARKSPARRRAARAIQEPE